MKRYAVIMVAVLVAIALFLGTKLTCWGFSIHNTLNSRAALEQRAAFLNSFGHSGRVIEIYSAIRGERENYSHNWYVVLRNERGEKRRIKFSDENPVRGEIWSVEYDGVPRLKEVENEIILREEIILPKDPMRVLVLRNAWWLRGIHRVLVVFFIPGLLLLAGSWIAAAVGLNVLLFSFCKFLCGDTVDSGTVSTASICTGLGALTVGTITWCGSVYCVLDAHLPAPHHAWYWLVWVAVVVLVCAFRVRAMVTSRRT